MVVIIHRSSFLNVSLSHRVSTGGSGLFSKLFNDLQCKDNMKLNESILITISTNKVIFLCNVKLLFCGRRYDDDTREINKKLMNEQSSFVIV